ncbi:MAG: hypothetical protein HUJ71_05070 [Pseudobutyrivibrio sp.]|nr:hypothetical protein [Pseudobutyrivibrio sp.]
MKGINNVNFLKASAVIDAILTYAAPAIGLMCTVLNGLNIAFYVKSKEKKGVTFFISALMLALGVLNCIFALLIGITELQYDIRHKFEQPIVKQPYSISKEVEPEENIKLMIPEATTVEGKLPNINSQLYNTATCDKTVFEDIEDPNFEYESVATYAGTGHFMMNSVMGKAKLGTPDSLECTVTTEDNSKESGLFIESSLPKYTYTWYLPYQCRFDAKNNRVYYIDEANGKQNDVFVTSLQNYSNYAKENNHSIDMEVGEYVGDTVYLIVNEIGSCEDYSVGWRDGYKIYNTWYVAVKTGQDAVIMDTYNY